MNTVVEDKAAPATQEAVQEETKKTKTKAKHVKNDDMLIQIVQEISGLSAADAIESVPALLNSADENYFRLGGVLSEIATKKYFELDGFETFKQFADVKYGLPYRKAMYWINIYDKLIESNVGWNKVKDVGWTKLKDLASVLTIENVDEWVQRALSSTTLQLQEAIAKSKAGTLPNSGIEPVATKSEVTTITFKVHADQKVTINEAIDKAMKEADTKFSGVALESIMMNYLAGGNVTGSTSLTETLKKFNMEDALHALEAAFPEFEVTAKMKKTVG